MSDVWTGIAEEFLHHYPRGRRLIAVAGADAERSRVAADALADVLSTAGNPVVRAHSEQGDESALRDEVVAPFRADSVEGAVLVVSGPSTLLSSTARGIWNFSLWQLAGDEPPHAAASALVDVTDPANPARRLADYCALPATFEA
jgi:hypothetical protein